MPIPFPTDWRTALVLVPHPDDAEYGMSAAVNRWTREGKRVIYVMATSGEAGIAGMDPQECGPIREAEQLRSAAVVGVHTVDFLHFPDGKLTNDASMRAAIDHALERHQPEVVITIFTGEEYAPGIRNQSDHMMFGQAVAETMKDHDDQWLFETAPNGEYIVEVSDEDVEAAVAALVEHEQYLRVLDPDTPVSEQARKQVEMSTLAPDGSRRSTFILRQERSAI